MSTQPSRYATLKNLLSHPFQLVLRFASLSKHSFPTAHATEKYAQHFSLVACQWSIKNSSATQIIISSDLNTDYH